MIDLNDNRVNLIEDNISHLVMKSSNNPDDALSISDFINLMNYDTNKLDAVTENIILFVFGVVIVFGFFGNILVICTVLLNKYMKTSGNLFTINLAISDLTLCVFSIPFMIYKALKHTWVLGDFMCRLAPFFQATNVFVSTMSITAIALDRYVTIVYAKNIRHNSKNKNQTYSSISILCVILIWILSFLISLPLFLFSKIEDSSMAITASLDSIIDFEYGFNESDISISINYTNTNKTTHNATTLLKKINSTSELDMKTNRFGYILYCVERWPHSYSRILYSSISLLIQYILPILIVGIAYGQIWWKLKRHRKKLRSYPTMAKTNNNLNSNEASRLFDQSTVSNQINQEPSKLSPIGQQSSMTRTSAVNLSSKKAQADEKRQRKMNILLAFIAIIFAASWLPLNIFNILSDSKMSNLKPNFGYYLLNTICILFAMSSAVSNPFLYGFLNENFKREYVKLFKKLKNRFLKSFNENTHENVDRTVIINNRNLKVLDDDQPKLSSDLKRSVATSTLEMQAL